MPGPDQPGDTPPDLPQEYAEAYRRGYQRAYEQGAGEAEAEQTIRLDSLDSASEQAKPVTQLSPVAPSDPSARPAHRQPDEDDDIRRILLAPAVLVGLTLLLLLSAYGLGRVFSSGVSDSDVASSEPDVLASSDDGTYDEPETDAPNGQKRYDGRVDPAAIGGASASCQSPSSVDAAGNAVTYEPANIYDGDTSTAWRCDGNGVGERITIALPEETAIGEVGLVPGYAKTDARSGVDRYAENNRITRVRWLFSDGSSVTQRLDGSADLRDLQTIRIPKAVTDQVVIEILSSTPGPRDTVAISDVRIGAISG